MNKYIKTKYEGYCVTKQGDVVSFRKPASKSTSDKRVDYSRVPKKLAYKTDKDGYFEVCLSVNKKKYYKKVHQVVCETFHGDKPDDTYVVDHINRNRQDNRPENLRWLPLSLNSDGWKGKKPSSCKRCLVNGILYGSILDACKALDTSYHLFRKYLLSKANIITFEGVETIEIHTGK